MPASQLKISATTDWLKCCHPLEKIFAFAHGYNPAEKVFLNPLFTILASYSLANYIFMTSLMTSE